MVVGDFLPVDDLGGVHRRGGIRGDAPLFLHHPHQTRQHPRHILCEIAAVRPGVGDELLLIEALGVVEGLLRRESKLAVGVPLEGGQVVECRGLLGPVFALHILHCRRPRRTALLRDLLRLGLFLHALSVRRKALRHKLDGVERLGLKAADRRLPVTDYRQRGRHHPAHIEGGAVLARKKPGGVDADDPVGALPAQGSLIQGVVFRSRSQAGEALPDGGVLHRRNPEPLKRLFALALMVDEAEDQLALPSGVGGLHDGGDILPAHQLLQHLELLLGGHGHLIPPLLRQDGQVLQPPLGVGLAVSLRLGQLHQMTYAPAHQIPAALQIAVTPFRGAQYLADALCHRGLLADHKFTHRQSLLSLFGVKK